MCVCLRQEQERERGTCASKLSRQLFDEEGRRAKHALAHSLSVRDLPASMRTRAAFRVQLEKERRADWVVELGQERRRVTSTRWRRSKRGDS